MWCAIFGLRERTQSLLMASAAPLMQQPLGGVRRYVRTLTRDLYSRARAHATARGRYQNSMLQSISHCGVALLEQLLTDCFKTTINAYAKIFICVGLPVQLIQ